MIIKIERAILHALDPSAGVAVLSEEPMDINEEVREFLDAHFIKCLESDESQKGTLREEGNFGQRMRALGRALEAGEPGRDAFIYESRQLAEQILHRFSQFRILCRMLCRLRAHRSLCIYRKLREWVQDLQQL